MDGGGKQQQRRRSWCSLLKKENNAATVLVIAATNRADVLDDALVRPGRFDVLVELRLPDARGREAILRVHARDKCISPSVDLSALAKRTPGFTGAGLESLLNAAAMIAVRRCCSDVDEPTINAALDRVVLGIERRTERSRAELEIVAFHEAGHAVVASRLLPKGALGRVSIVARGSAGGTTIIEPPSDFASRDELERRLAVLLGGRAGEELGLAGGRSAVTVGATADIEAARTLAKDMVERFGLGRGGLTVGASRADEEANALVKRAHERARRELSSAKRRGLHEVAAALLERKTLSGDEVAAFVRASPWRFHPQTP